MKGDTWMGPRQGRFLVGKLMEKHSHHQQWRIDRQRVFPARIIYLPKGSHAPQEPAYVIDAFGLNGD